MDHKTALNLILANACGGLTDEEVAANEGYQQYTIELHCDAFTLDAKCIAKPPQGEEGEYEFDIRSCVRK